MAAKRTICIFLTVLIVFAFTESKKGSNSSTVKTRETFEPQGFNDYDSGSAYLNLCDKCGVRGGSQNPTVKIVNGTEAEYGEFPWKCYLLIHFDDGSRASCTCNIMSPEWVLVAAHCAIAPADHMTVFAGMYDTTKPELDDRDIVKVADYIVHEGWDPRTLVNDIALMRLTRPLDFTRMDIEPVCMPYKFKGLTFEWRTVTASGYGRTSWEEPADHILRKVDLQVVPIDACRNWWQHTGTVTEKHICAYGMPVSPAGLCHGDSGSSLDFRDPSTGRYYAIGIASWVAGHCSTKEFPNVFTDVTKYLDWIDYKTGTHFCG